MTTLTEKQHAGEFLISEGEGSISREKGTLASGNVVTDGTVLALSGGKLVPATGGSSDVVVGIAYGYHDATSADLAGVPYIARLAEVDTSLVYVDGSGSLVDWTSLNALFIIGR